MSTLELSNLNVTYFSKKYSSKLSHVNPGHLKTKHSGIYLPFKERTILFGIFIVSYATHFGNVVIINNKLLICLLHLK